MSVKEIFSIGIQRNRKTATYCLEVQN